MFYGQSGGIIFTFCEKIILLFFTIKLATLVVMAPPPFINKWELAWELFYPQLAGGFWIVLNVICFGLHRIRMRLLSCKMIEIHLADNF